MLDRDFGDHDRSRFADQIRGQHSQQVRVAVRLIAQSVGKGRSDWTIFGTQKQIYMRDFITITTQCFADVHGHGADSKK